MFVCGGIFDGSCGRMRSRGESSIFPVVRAAVNVASFAPDIIGCGSPP